MKFDYKALIRLMKKSYKGGGIKIIRTERELRDCFFLSGAGWALLIPQGKVPRRGHRPDRHLAGRPAPHRVCRLGGEGL